MIRLTESSKSGGGVDYSFLSSNSVPNSFIGDKVLMFMWLVRLAEGVMSGLCSRFMEEEPGKKRQKDLCEEYSTLVLSPFYSF